MATGRQHADTYDMFEPSRNYSTRATLIDSAIYTRVREVLRLVILDPQITEAILEGRQPRTLSLESLVRQSLPLDWEAQRQMVAEAGVCR